MIENLLISNLFENRGIFKGTLIDVGAHRGNFLKNYANNDWTVYAFEPDPKNRKFLLKRMQNHKNVFIFPEAVSHQNLKNINFFSSNVSAGISSLHPFHESHHLSTQVNTITLNSFCINNSISKVDLLKIDAEGHDLFVLKGFPFNQIKPKIIFVEFEDRKTIPIGYSHKELIHYLLEYNYNLLISEWYPIHKYGARHKWKQFALYPYEISDKNSWGNIIAYSNTFSLNDLLFSISYCLRKQQIEKVHIKPKISQRFKRKLNEINISLNIYAILFNPHVMKITSYLNKYSKNNSNFLRIFLGKFSWKLKYKKLLDSYSNTDLYIKYSEKRRNHIKRWGPLPGPYREKKRLKILKNSFKGKRIFIIGNGPSLNRTPLEKLNNDYTFAVNRIYLLFSKIKWKPTFYTTHDWRFIPDNVDEINALKDMIFFFPENFRSVLRSGNDVYWYWTKNSIHSNEEFSHDITNGVMLGGTVIFITIQIARYLGFDPIYLIGVDADYTIPKTVKQEGKVLDDGNKNFLESTQDDDPNHFDPKYFGKGKKWHHPYVPNMIKGFEICRQAVTSHGGQIFNATVGGKLEVFERVDFNKLF